MTEAQADEGMHQRFVDGWLPLHPAAQAHPQHVPFTFRNEAKFSTQQLGALGAWSRFAINPTTANQKTQGEAPNRKFDYRGNIMVQLFAAVNHISTGGVVLDGNEVLKALVEDVRTIVGAQSIIVAGGRVITRAARRQNLKEDGVWNACVVVIPYYFEETR